MTFKVDDEVLETLERLASQGLSNDQIADVLGISRATFYNTKNANLDFLDTLKRGKSKGIDEITNALFEKAKKGDTTSMIFYLKNRDSENWRDRHDVHHTQTLEEKREHAYKVLESAGIDPNSIQPKVH